MGRTFFIAPDLQATSQGGGMKPRKIQGLKNTVRYNSSISGRLGAQGQCGRKQSRLPSPAVTQSSRS